MQQVCAHRNIFMLPVMYRGLNIDSSDIKKTHAQKPRVFFYAEYFYTFGICKFSGHFCKVACPVALVTEVQPGHK